MVYVLSAVEKVSSKFFSKTKNKHTMASILLLATDNRGWGYARRHVVLCESGFRPICYLHNHRLLVTRDYTISYARCRRWKIVWCTIRWKRIYDDCNCSDYKGAYIAVDAQYWSIIDVDNVIYAGQFEKEPLNALCTKKNKKDIQPTYKLVCTWCNNQQAQAPWTIQQYNRQRIEVLTHWGSSIAVMVCIGIDWYSIIYDIHYLVGIWYIILYMQQSNCNQHAWECSSAYHIYQMYWFGNDTAWWLISKDGNVVESSNINLDTYLFSSFCILC